jgi:nucleotide-binding universal stress UspA family protein
LTVDASRSIAEAGDATVLVLARPVERGAAAIGAHAEALLRSCRRPVLFVPGV